MSAAVWAGIAMLGGAGALARFWLDGAVSRRTAAVFPAGTLVVNVTGALTLGILAAADVSTSARLIAGTGLLGAYTTFSTWMLETHRLGEDGRTVAMVANVVLSLVLGLGAVALGRAIG